MIDLNGELMPELAIKGEVNGFVTHSWWYDVGSLDKIAKLPHSKLNDKLSHLFEENLLTACMHQCEFVMPSMCCIIE